MFCVVDQCVTSRVGASLRRSKSVCSSPPVNLLGAALASSAGKSWLAVRGGDSSLHAAVQETEAPGGVTERVVSVLYNFVRSWECRFRVCTCNPAEIDHFV